MIDYQKADSPFYELNKAYCEAVEKQLRESGAACSGFCNSYGFDLKAEVKTGRGTYTLEFHKHQVGRNGIIIPENAGEYCQTRIRASGLDKEFNISIGKSALRRIFTTARLREKLPAPYFAGGSGPLDSFIPTILSYRLTKFKITHGELYCEMQTALKEPLTLLSELETVFAAN